MKYVSMGSQKVSAIGLGTWQFGESGWGWGRDLDYEDAERIIHRALELGINFFDTAAMYSSGHSEEILGEALKGRRDEVVIATKVFPPLDPDRIKLSIEESLRRLGVDNVDLYQIHVPDPNIPIAQTMGALRELMDSGQVRQVGVSNFDLDQWKEADAALGRPAIANQVEYHLLERRYAEDVLPYAREQNRIVSAYSPLAQGLLSGKYRGDSLPQDARITYDGPGYHKIFTRDNIGRAPAVVEVLREVGQRHGASPAQVALAWLLRDPQVNAIPGARSISQIEANAAAADLEFTPEEDQRIEQATRV